MKYNIYYTNRFKKQYKKLNREIKDSVIDSIKKLQADPFYSSLHTEKIKGTNFYSSRVNINYRFSWQFKSDENNSIIIRNIDEHDKLYNNP
jgi:mRNA-degrading endonuclease RelE of RelBE toxin-antitoxin system